MDSLIASEEFDANGFSRSSNRESDFISRLSAGLKAAYQSKPFTLLATGGLDAEYFAEHPELSGGANRKRAGRTGPATACSPRTSTSYRLTKWLGLNANYRFSLQDQASIRIPDTCSISYDPIYPILAD